MTNFIEEQQKEDWQPAKWVLEPTDPLLNWKKGWNEGGDAAVTAFIQGKRLQIDKMPDGKSWMVCYLPLNEEHEEWAELGKPEANARQKMINYLIAEGIITTL